MCCGPLNNQNPNGVQVQLPITPGDIAIFVDENTITDGGPIPTFSKVPTYYAQVSVTTPITITTEDPTTIIFDTIDQNNGIPYSAAQGFFIFPATPTGNWQIGTTLKFNDGETVTTGYVYAGALSFFPVQDGFSLSNISFSTYLPNRAAFQNIGIYVEAAIEPITIQPGSVFWIYSLF